MRASVSGRQALALPTNEEAEMVTDAVITALEATPLNNLGSNGFTLKLGGLGKFSVRHKPGIRRKVGFPGETIQTKMLCKVKFITLGRLRQGEQVTQCTQNDGNRKQSQLRRKYC